MRFEATSGIKSSRKKALSGTTPAPLQAVYRVRGASFLKVCLCEGRVMAQEQAKSPPVGAETGTNTDTSASLNTGKDPGEDAQASCA